MKKGQRPSRSSRIPDPLNAFAKKIHLRGGKSKDSLKELLTSQLSPPQCQLDYLPLIANLGKCNEINDKMKEVSGDNSDNDRDKQMEGTLKNEFNNDIPRDDSKEITTEESENEVKCLNCLMDDITLSFDGKWLRNYLQLPLKMAIKEIIAKKPYDPVNYLGFWLLNYRKCQENNHWQLEANQELDHYRSLFREPALAVEEQISVDREEEEEEAAHDWNFKYYEAVRNRA